MHRVPSWAVLPSFLPMNATASLSCIPDGQPQRILSAQGCSEELGAFQRHPSIPVTRGSKADPSELPEGPQGLLWSPRLGPARPALLASLASASCLSFPGSHPSLTLWFAAPEGLTMRSSLSESFKAAPPLHPYPGLGLKSPLWTMALEVSFLPSWSEPPAPLTPWGCYIPPYGALHTAPHQQEEHSSLNGSWTQSPRLPQA